MALAPLSRGKKGKRGLTAEGPQRPGFRRQALGGSRGTSLSRELQTRARTTFGSDLSGVRVHTDDTATRSAEHLSANAFTIGRDIYFNRNAYQPSRPEGTRLLGHELAHVVQQHGGAGARADITTNPAPHETAADEAARAFLARAPAKLARRASVPTVDHGANEADAYPIQRETKAGPVPSRNAEEKDGEDPGPETRTRTKFDTQLTVLFGPADIHFTGVSDSDKDGLDDASQLRRIAALNAPGIYEHELININHGTRILREYYDNDISIGNLIVSSHGVYGANKFWVGSEEVTKDDIHKLAAWKPLLNTDTKVLFTACNLGGGDSLDEGKKVSRLLAETLGATVYTNRSFSASSKKNFTGEDKPMSWYGDPADEKRSEIELYPKAYVHMGEWLQSIPPEVLKEWEQKDFLGQSLASFVQSDKTAQSITNSPYYTPEGEFGIAEDRFHDRATKRAYEEYFKLHPWVK